ncbi:MAG: STAS/SEC14 domain-containing protein [Deltaproteobacteria bacterium]|nr:STAS/SEC14 domain-containing protein [Deltaproteobacteria bacterium]
MIEKIAEKENGVVGFRIQGSFTKEDFARIKPQLKDMLKRHGNLSVFLDLTDFQGLAVRFGLRDAVRGRKYNKRLFRLAVVDDGKWADYFADKAAKYLKGEVRTFDPKNKDQAWEWLAA